MPKKKNKPKAMRVKRRSPTTVSGGIFNVTARAKTSAGPDSWVLPVVVVVSGLCLVVAAWGVWLLLSSTGRLLFTNNPRFTLREIHARSDGTIPADLLVEWSRVEPGTNLYSVHLPEVRRHMESHPIVRRATVRRRLPDQLEIAVVERVPIARTGLTEGHMNWLVDAEGVVIRRSFEHRELPFLGGVRPDTISEGGTLANGPAGDALAYLERLRDMPALKRELFDVRSISVGHPEFLVAILRGGTQAYLPRDRDPREVLERATRMLEENRRTGQANEDLDLRPEGNHSIGVRR